MLNKLSVVPYTDRDDCDPFSHSEIKFVDIDGGTAILYKGHNSRISVKDCYGRTVLDYANNMDVEGLITSEGIFEEFVGVPNKVIDKLVKKFL